MFWQLITRCIPGLNIIGLVVLLFWLWLQPMDEDSDQSISDWAHVRHLSLLSKVFIIHSLLLNLNLIWFVIRTSLAFLHITKQTDEILSRRTSKAYERSDISKADEQEVIHAIIIPNYRETVDTLWISLSALAKHPRASSQYEVCSQALMQILSRISLYLITKPESRYILQWNRKRKVPRQRRTSYYKHFDRAFVISKLPFTPIICQERWLAKVRMKISLLIKFEEHIKTTPM